jgi:hypothetical protein
MFRGFPGTEVTACTGTAGTEDGGGAEGVQLSSINAAIPTTRAFLIRALLLTTWVAI